MGTEVDQEEFDERDYMRFAERLKECLSAPRLRRSGFRTATAASATVITTTICSSHRATRLDRPLDPPGRFKPAGQRTAPIDVPAGPAAERAPPRHTAGTDTGSHAVTVPGTPGRAGRDQGHRLPLARERPGAPWPDRCPCLHQTPAR